MSIGFLLNLFLSISANANGPEKEAKFALKVKSEIAKLGSGRESKVKIKLRDNNKFSGYIGEINEESFTLIDSKSAQPTVVQYSQIKKASGKNNLNGRSILVGIGVAFVILAVVSIVLSDTGV